MHNYYYNKQPKGFLNFFSPCPAREILPNRQTNYKIEKSKNNTLENLPSVQLPLIWNREDLQSRLISSLPQFKTLVTKGLLDSYILQAQ